MAFKNTVQVSLLQDLPLHSRFTDLSFTSSSVKFLASTPKFCLSSGVSIPANQILSFFPFETKVHVSPSWQIFTTPLNRDAFFCFEKANRDRRVKSIVRYGFI